MPTFESSHSVREAGDGDRAILAEVLVEAFQRDPLAHWLYPDPTERREAHTRLFGRVLTGGPKGIVVDATESLDAVAIWQAPDAPKDSSPDPLLKGEASRLFQMIAAAAPGNAYSKLMFLGARMPGTGAGTALLKYRLPLLAEPVALWTGNENNLAFYGKFGFEVVSRHDVEGASAYWLVLGG